MKAFVLDTNVLLSDPNAITAFGDNLVIIPTVVLQEVDHKKKQMDEIGRNAREVGRLLEKIRERDNLSKGAELNNGGKLRIISPPSDSVVYDSYGKEPDSRIVATANAFQKDYPFTCCLVSQDVLVRIKAGSLGIESEDYLNDKIITSKDEHYQGFQYIESNAKDISAFNKGHLILEDAISLLPNEFAVLKNGSQEEPAFIKEDEYTKLYNYKNDGFVFGLSAKNTKQKMAFELLLNKDIPLVTLSGKAGTGKTLLALAAGLQQTMEDNRYKKVIVGRPVIPMGKDIGYLPGEKEDKLRPWMQPVYDNLEYLFNCKDEEELEDVLGDYKSKYLEVEALTYIRGRSIPNQFIIIDEAQNLTQHEVKTIITRAGIDSKVVLIGDPDQIDHPYLDQYSNGLTYVIEKMKHLKESGHVRLTDGERSKLAQLAADTLN